MPTYKLADELAPEDVIVDHGTSWRVESVATDVLTHAVRFSVTRTCEPSQPALSVLTHPEAAFQVRSVAA